MEKAFRSFSLDRDARALLPFFGSGGVAQLAEQENHNLCVRGSSPCTATRYNPKLVHSTFQSLFHYEPRQKNQGLFQGPLRGELY